MKMELRDGYRYDENGYYLDTILVQIGKGISLPERTTLEEPNFQEGFWYKYIINITCEYGWVEEKIPNAISDLLNYVVYEDDYSERGIYLKNLMKKLTSKENSEYYISIFTVKIDNEIKKIWSIEKY